MGSESVGVVDALGEGVDDVSIGQRVITVGVRETWQEFVVADARRVLAAPEAVERIDRGADDYKSADRAVARDKST